MYAVGVCLYQLLCERVPFAAASPAQALAHKRAGYLPPSPSIVLRGSRPVPDDLEQLCMALLDPDPRLRPTAGETRRRLLGNAVLPEGSSIEVARQAPPYTGREGELAKLDACLQGVLGGAQKLALVQGESGIGKSALVEEWVQRMRAECPEVVVLRSRCHENEQLAYKALDAGVDGLARRLRLRPGEACRALLPRHAAVLAELFPVLASVRAIAEAPRKGLVAGARERRRQGFEALRELLQNLAAEAPLVWLVDDLQWADAESLVLLETLLKTDVPARLMFVATQRPPHEVSSEAREGLEALSQHPRSVLVPLGPLAARDARRLAVLQTLARMNTPRARHMVPMLRAQWHLLDGDRDGALEQVRLAHRVLESASHYWVHPAAYLEGCLVGGEQGRALCEQALAFYARQGWRRPERAVAIQLPVLAAM